MAALSPLLFAELTRLALIACVAQRKTRQKTSWRAMGAQHRAASLSFDLSCVAQLHG